MISSKSGSVFEKRLALKHIAAQGVDPVTDEPLLPEDLIAVATASHVIKPRPPAATSIPTLLMTLQNEWDAVALETFTLKKKYHESRLELSNALYELDAAKRVIARLIKEKQEAQEQLAESVGKKKSDKDNKVKDTEDVEMDAGLPSSISETLDATATELSAVRRKRKPPQTLANNEAIQSYAVVSETQVHTAKEPVSLSLDLLVTEEPIEWLLSAGKDGSCHVVDATDGSALSSCKTHKAPVNQAVWLGQSKAFATSSADFTVKTWRLESVKNGFKTKPADSSFDSHDDQVTGLSCHPSGQYFISASSDASWAFHDVEAAKTIFTAKGDKKSGYSCAQFHPDGLLLGAGTQDSLVRIFDVKSKANIHSFADGHRGSINSISFSENGYILATSSVGQSAINLWDLRKLAIYHTIDFQPDESVGRVRFDHSGQYVGALVGSELRIYNYKKWDVVNVFKQDSSAILNDFVFGPDAKYIAFAGNDRKVSILSSK